MLEKKSTRHSDGVRQALQGTNKQGLRQWWTVGLLAAGKDLLFFVIPFPKAIGTTPADRSAHQIQYVIVAVVTLVSKV
jgi:hypothetical protein